MGDVLRVKKLPDNYIKYNQTGKRKEHIGYIRSIFLGPHTYIVIKYHGQMILQTGRDIAVHFTSQYQTHKKNHFHTYFRKSENETTEKCTGNSKRRNHTARVIDALVFSLFCTLYAVKQRAPPNSTRDFSNSSRRLSLSTISHISLLSLKSVIQRKKIKGKWK